MEGGRALVGEMNSDGGAGQGSNGVGGLAGRVGGGEPEARICPMRECPIISAVGEVYRRC